MLRILFAINQKETEEQIARRMEGQITVTSAAQYREAVIAQLSTNAADVILISESLPGNKDYLDLLHEIRFCYPNVRIITIIRERESKTDPFLTELVSLGIYDIINQNEIPVTDIISHISTPGSFRDVAEYYGGAPKDLITHDNPMEEPKKGLAAALGKIKGKSKKDQKNYVVIKMPSQPQDAADIDALREAIREQAEKDARANLEAVAEEKAKEQNQKLLEEIVSLQKKCEETEASRKSAEEQSFRSIDELNKAKKANLAMNQELDDMRHAMEESSRVYLDEIEKLKKDNSAEILRTKESEWAAEKESFESKITELENKLESAPTANVKASAASYNDLDITQATELGFVMPEDPSDFKPLDPDKQHVILFTGSKHGVGTSTAALNIASVLAETGSKTILLELDRKYPMVSHFFELLSIPRGIDTAASGLRDGNNIAVDAAIIKPHSIPTDKQQLQRAYTKLPAALHFMLVSNTYISRRSSQELYAEDVLAVVRYLRATLGYQYVILDVNSDTEIGESLMLYGGNALSRLVIVSTQDPQSVTLTGMLIRNIIKDGAAGTWNKVAILLNEYQQTGELTVSGISKWLSTEESRFMTVSSDRAGYYKCALAMQPYALSTNRYVKELHALAEKI